MSERSLPAMPPAAGSRRTLRGLVAAALGSASAGLMTGSLHAQSVEEEIVVTDSQRSTYRVEDGSMSKLTESLRDTPQSINAIPKELLDDRGVVSLNDALRNVPGIT